MTLLSCEAADTIELPRDLDAQVRYDQATDSAQPRPDLTLAADSGAPPDGMCAAEVCGNGIDEDCNGQDEREEAPDDNDLAGLSVGDLIITEIMNNPKGSDANPIDDSQG